MKKTSRIILAIETSCDDTAIALVKCSGTLKSPKFEVLENIVSSQIAIHRPFGGVVPNLAKREHLKNLPKIFKGIMNNELRIKSGGGKSIIHNSKFIIPAIDSIAVTVGPGLEPALWAGINFAEELSAKLKKPLIGANHMEGHLYSCFLPQKATEISNSKFLSLRDISRREIISKNKSKSSKLKAQSSKIAFPAIALIVSGGHTILLHMTAINKWTKLGETLDDAAGEAFDKVARMLELPYPGGPEIQKLAAKGNPNAIKFPRPLLNPKSAKDKYNFSFSGLKTSVLYYLRDHAPSMNNESITNKRIPQQVQNGEQIESIRKFETNSLFADIAASFQQAVIDVLTKKTARAAKEFNAKTILLCGGVSANKPLQESLRAAAYGLRANFIVPDFQYNTDNAAMIAVAAYINSLQKNKNPLPMEADGNLTI